MNRVLTLIICCFLMRKNPERQLVRKKESTRGDYEAEKRALFTIRPGNSILIHLFTVAFSIYFIAALCICAEFLFHMGKYIFFKKTGTPKHCEFSSCKM